MEYSDEFEIYQMVDEDGSEVTVQALDYFYYNGDEYAVMTELAEGEEPWGDEDDGRGDPEIFFMKVVPLEDDTVEFQPVDEDLSDELSQILEAADDEDLPDEEE